MRNVFDRQSNLSNTLTVHMSMGTHKRLKNSDHEGHSNVSRSKAYRKELLTDR